MISQLFRNSWTPKQEAHHACIISSNVSTVAQFLAVRRLPAWNRSRHWSASCAPCHWEDASRSGDPRPERRQARSELGSRLFDGAGLGQSARKYTCNVSRAAVTAETDCRAPSAPSPRGAQDHRTSKSIALFDLLEMHSASPFTHSGRRFENHVAALDVGSHIAAFGIGEKFGQLFHGQPMLAANIDSAQQGDQ